MHAHKQTKRKITISLPNLWIFWADKMNNLSASIENRNCVLVFFGSNKNFDITRRCNSSNVCQCIIWLILTHICWRLLDIDLCYFLTEQIINFQSSFGDCIQQ
jgi:hypothetical protein